MRRSSPIAVLAVSVVLLGLFGTATRVAAAEPLDTLTVFAGDRNPVTSNFDLVQGQEYTVVLTGTAVYSYGSGDPNYADALYLYDIEACPDPCESGHLNYRIGEGEFVNSALPTRPPGGPPAAPAYNNDHRYQWVFTAPASGALSYRDTGGLDPENSTGTYRIEIYGAGGPSAPTNVTVTEPAPGETVSLQGPDPLPRNGGTVRASVTNSSGDLNDTTVVGEGKVKKKARQVGEAIASCWFIGPDAFQITGKSDQLVVNTDIGTIPLRALIRAAQDKFIDADATQAFHICMTLGDYISEAHEPFSTSPRMVAAAQTEAGCRVKRVALDLSSRNGKVTKVRLSETQRRPASEARYTCTSSAAGAMDMTVTHGRDRSLRQDLGPRLDVGVVRQANTEPRDATLTFGFN